MVRIRIMKTKSCNMAGRDKGRSPSWDAFLTTCNWEPRAIILSAPTAVVERRIFRYADFDTMRIRYREQRKLKAVE